MSFMFHPYPYSDPNAVNNVTGCGVMPTSGVHAVAAQIALMVKENKKIGIDAFPGTDIASLVNVLRQRCAGLNVTC